MKRIYVLSLLLLFSFVLKGQVVNSSPSDIECDSLAMKVTLYFSSGESRKLTSLQREKLDGFIEWAKLNPLIPISINGWADRSGTAFQNARVSLFRARTVRNYIVSKGIPLNRVFYKGNGVDSLSQNSAVARRADVCGRVVISVKTPPITKESDVGIITKKEIPDVPSEVAFNDSLPINMDNFTSENLSNTNITYSSKYNTLESSKFYAGVTLGLSFGKSTLSSLATYGDYAGFNIGVLGGYRINQLYALEIFMNYTWLKLYGDKSFGDYYIDDTGTEYVNFTVEPQVYSYKQIHANSRVFTLGIHYVINFVPLWNKISDWSLLFIPNISGVYTRADVKSEGNTIFSRTYYHFALGADIGTEYKLNDFIALRFTTGLNFITGKSIDGLPKNRNKTNYTWNNLFGIILNY